MSRKKYIVELTEEERSVLQDVVKRLQGTSQKVKRANILLKADIGGACWTDAKIAEALDCRTKTVENVRQRFVERGLEETLNGKQRDSPPTEKLLDGEQEAKIIAMRLGEAPKGYGKWTLRLLARKAVELEIVDSISYQTVRRTLKKTANTKRNVQYWVIPPEANAEFVAHMEDVLDVYSRPYDPCLPVLCMDEQPVQLVEEIKAPLPATRHHPKRVDYEYRRSGVAKVFMFAEPLALWRQVSVRDKKTKVDWAVEMANLLEGRYAKCEKVLVVCDNLNTHTIGAFYDAFEPERARSLVRRIEFHHTPKHGSWLNIAENELSCLTGQCVAGRRIGSAEQLREQSAAWHEDVNQIQRGVEWQMKIDDARTKLKSVYPEIKV
ncbi:IS630 family transposase [Aeoliella mucimassa]